METYVRYRILNSNYQSPSLAAACDKIRRITPEASSSHIFYQKLLTYFPVMKVAM